MCARANPTLAHFLIPMPHQSCGVMSIKLLTTSQAVHDRSFGYGIVTLFGIWASPRVREALDPRGPDRWHERISGLTQIWVSVLIGIQRRNLPFREHNRGQHRSLRLWKSESSMRLSMRLSRRITKLRSSLTYVQFVESGAAR